MSQVSSFHSVVAHTTSSKAFAEQRLVVIHYKGKAASTNKEGKVTAAVPRFPSLCVSIPTLRMNTAGMNSAIASVTVSLWESLQDDLIRSLVDARRSKDQPSQTMKSTVSDDEITLEAIAAFASATGNGKLSGDSISQWFDSVLTEPLIEALLTSDPDRSDDQVKTLLANYRSAMMKLAAVVPGLATADYNQLRKALAKAPEDDVMSQRLITKIDAQGKAKAAALDGL